MRNINFKVDDAKKEIHIIAKLDGKPELSKSRKTFLVATTNGAVPIGTDDIDFSINIYKPNPDYKPV